MCSPPMKTMQISEQQSPVVIGTRGSKLALVQAEMVQQMLLAAHPGLEVRIEKITTKGDVVLDRPLSAIGDKGLFVGEIEDALRAGRVDMAVHSAKDLPSALPPDMAMPFFPQRADPRDVLVARDGATTLMNLSPGARVGTSSLRRACQLRHARPDLELADIRGNVDTRLRKLDEGQYDAIVLAAAGLNRLGLAARVTEWLDPLVMLPAVAQGALGIEVRAHDEAIAALLQPLDHPPTRLAVTAERAFLERIQGGCQVPVGAHAIVEGDTLHITGMIGDRAGHVVRGERSGPAEQAAALGAALADALLANGGRAMLEQETTKTPRTQS
jgi:hydroxymethylbilane synthase